MSEQGAVRISYYGRVSVNARKLLAIPRVKEIVKQAAKLAKSRGSDE